MNIKKYLSTGAIILISWINTFAALDLQFTTSITQSPSPAIAGSTVQFNASFITSGGAVTNLKIIGGIDGTQLFERTYAGIAADKTRSDLFTWTATSGNHTAWFELDPDHTTGDSNYANNRVEKSFAVGSGILPDIKISAVFKPYYYNSGDGIRIEVDLSYEGEGNSIPSILEIRKSTGSIPTETVLYTIDIPSFGQSLGRGGRSKAVKNLVVECGATIIAEIDTTDTNNESNENNNTWSDKLVCHSTTPWDNFSINIPLVRLPEYCVNIANRWHNDWQSGDYPKSSIESIGFKLARGQDYIDVVKEWKEYLHYHNCLNPNKVLQVIFESSKKYGQEFVTGEEAIAAYRIKVKDVLVRMAEMAKQRFEIFKWGR